MQKIIRIVLLLSVLMLSVLILLPSSQPAIAGSLEREERAPGIRPSRIVWINTDTINKYYLGFQEIFRTHGAMLERIAERIEKRNADYNSRYDLLQKRLFRGRITPEEQQLRERELNLILFEIEQMNNDYAELEAETYRKNDSINIVVEKFVSAFSKQFGYDYVLMVGEGSPVLYANDELDITREIIEGLNLIHQRAKR